MNFGLTIEIPHKMLHFDIVFYYAYFFCSLHPQGGFATRNEADEYNDQQKVFAPVVKSLHFILIT